MALRRLAYKYRIRPTDEQQALLVKTFGCCRYLYNRYVEWNNNAYKEWVSCGRKKGEYAKIPVESVFKAEDAFLREVDSTALMNVRRHFSQSVQNFIKSCTGKRKGRKTKAPTFHKKGKCRNSFTSSIVNGNIRLDGNLLRLPKLGDVEVIMHRELPCDARILSVTVSMERDGSLYASMMFETEMMGQQCRARVKPLAEQRVIGLDMSLSDFYVSSDKEAHTRTKYVRNYRKAEKSLKRLNRQHSRRMLFATGEYVFSKRWNKDVEKKKPSKNREKARLRMARQYRKIANRRLDFVCQEASRLSKAYDVIVIEDIDMQAMARSLHLGKSANDLGFGLFKQRLEWACQKNGCLLVKADRWFASSKTCNECGAKNEALKLSDREWVCPSCGKSLDRDFNAASNLRNWYLTHYNTAGTAEIYACGDSINTFGQRPNANAVIEAGKSVSDDGSPSL